MNWRGIDKLKALTVGRVNLIRSDVIEACRERNLWGPVSWIGVRGTKFNQGEWE